MQPLKRCSETSSPPDEIYSSINIKLQTWAQTSDIDDQLRARKTIEEIANDPYSLKQLRGKYQELRSARLGNYRIVYAIKEQGKEIVLLAIELRGAIYRR